jgi:hypothetical protein
MHQLPSATQARQSSSQAIFFDPLQAVSSQVGLARFTLNACIEGFCGRAWFELMLNSLRRGLSVSLGVEAIPENLNSALAWERLTALGGQLVWLKPDQTALHTSVCLMDGRVVMSGNFARPPPLVGTNFNGILIQDDPELVIRCSDALMALRQTNQWQTDAADPVLGPLTVAQTAQAVALIETVAPPQGWLLTSPGESLQKIALCQFQVLEQHALAMEADTAEALRKTYAFDHAQDQAIGELLRQLLDAKQRCMVQRHARFGGQQNQEDAAAAQAAFAAFEQTHQTLAQTPVAQPLDPQEQAEIKQLYRKLAMICHPDRVEDGHKSHAEAVFQQLQQSYRTSDFAAMKHLEASLQTQTLGDRQLGPTEQGIASLDWRLAKLQERLAGQRATRDAIFRSPTWRTLSTQSNWALWFSQQAMYLQDEITRYEQALEAMMTTQARA